MSITNPVAQVPVNDTIGAWLRRHLGWMLTCVAVVAAAVLVTLLVLDDGSTAERAPAAESISSAERDSTTDIEYHVGGGVRVR